MALSEGRKFHVGREGSGKRADRRPGDVITRHTVRTGKVIFTISGMNRVQITDSEMNQKGGTSKGSFRCIHKDMPARIRPVPPGSNATE